MGESGGASLPRHEPAIPKSIQSRGSILRGSWFTGDTLIAAARSIGEPVHKQTLPEFAENTLSRWQPNPWAGPEQRSVPVLVTTNGLETQEYVIVHCTVSHAKSSDAASYTKVNSIPILKTRQRALSIFADSALAGPSRNNLHNQQ